jgi:hypothetical protein
MLRELHRAYILLRGAISTAEVVILFPVAFQVLTRLKKCPWCVNRFLDEGFVRIVAISLSVARCRIVALLRYKIAHLV